MVNNGSHFMKTIADKASEKRVPLIGSFELTSRCNLQCNFCYVCHRENDKKVESKELSIEKWLKIAHEAREAGMLYLLLTGGEVFLRKDFRQIYEKLTLMGFVIQIYTNATMITPEVVKWLKKSPPGRISVSLYGASHETYDIVCNNRKGFEDAIRGINLLTRENFNLSLRMAITQKNVSDFYKVALLAEERDVPFFIVNYISPEKDIKKNSSVIERMLPEDQIKFEREVEDYFRQKYGKTSIKDVKCLDDNNMEGSYEKGQQKKQKLHHNGAFSCSAAKIMFFITWDGKMTPCALMDQPCAYPLINGFKSSWQELQERCRKVPECLECRGCEYEDYCIACPAGLKNETGHFDKPAPYFCETARLRKNLKH